MRRRGPPFPLAETRVSDLDIFGHRYDLYEMFDYYNQLCFNNELRPARMAWARELRGAAGLCEFVGTRAGRLARPITIRLSLPLLSFRSEYDITNVLLHEMIHALLFQQGVFEPEGGHGPVFMSVAQRVNVYFGFRVTRYHYHIDPERYRQLDREKRARVDNTFLGEGRTIRGPAGVLSQEEIIDLTVEDDAPVDLDVRFVDEPAPGAPGSVCSLGSETEGEVYSVD